MLKGRREIPFRYYKGGEGLPLDVTREETVRAAAALNRSRRRPRALLDRCNAAQHLCVRLESHKWKRLMIHHNSSQFIINSSSIINA